MSAAIKLSADVSDPLAAALLEIAELNERLERTASLLDASESSRNAVYRMYQTALHRAETAEAKLGAEVRAAKTGGYELEVHCDNSGCVTPPIRIAKLPPEDAIPLWVSGMGWACDGDRYLCPCCKGGK